MEEKMYEGLLPNGVPFRYMYMDGIWGFALDLPSGNTVICVMNNNGLFLQAQGPEAEKKLIRKSMGLIENEIRTIAQQVMGKYGLSYFQKLKEAHRGDILTRYPEIMQNLYSAF